MYFTRKTGRQQANFNRGVCSLTVKWFNNRKGYGFITHDSGWDVFAQFPSLAGQAGFHSLEEGVRVEYQIEEREKVCPFPAVKGI